MVQSDELSESERDALRALVSLQQTAAWEPGGWFAEVASRVQSARGSYQDEDVEQEVVEALRAPERKGYVEKIGETEDLARFSIYKVTPVGLRSIEG